MLATRRGGTVITSTEIFGTEEAILERNPRAAEVHRSMTDTARAAILDLYRSSAGAKDEETLTRVDTELEAIMSRTMAEYARRVSGLVSAEDVELWTAKITRVPGRYVLRAREVGVPGALTLLESMEIVDLANEHGDVFVSLDDSLANGAEYCQCGYAQTRVVPEQFCQLCSPALLHEWRAEENRVLAASPELAAQFEIVLDELLDALALAHLDMTAPQAASVGIRRKAGKKLAMLNESSAIDALDLTRWEELEELNTLSGIAVVRDDQRHWPTWGLGTARSVGLMLRSSPELEARMMRIAGARPAPTPSFFERLFSRG